MWVAVWEKGKEIYPSGSVTIQPYASQFPFLDLFPHCQNRDNKE